MRVLTRVLTMALNTVRAVEDYKQMGCTVAVTIFCEQSFACATLGMRSSLLATIRVRPLCIFRMWKSGTYRILRRSQVPLTRVFCCLVVRGAT